MIKTMTKNEYIQEISELVAKCAKYNKQWSNEFSARRYARKSKEELMEDVKIWKVRLDHYLVEEAQQEYLKTEECIETTKVCEQYTEKAYNKKKVIKTVVENKLQAYFRVLLGMDCNIQVNTSTVYVYIENDEVSIPIYLHNNDYKDALNYSIEMNVSARGSFSLTAPSRSLSYYTAIGKILAAGADVENVIRPVMNYVLTGFNTIEADYKVYFEFLWKKTPENAQRVINF